ncbi:Facilitated trehalose transporter Tret1 [Eumeta japonica]|uniref:Facilitated trehalose transporter Tret1 n=1 Tax=Eumeta variegata TaxID=151549 RepID=A0A4C1VKV5_EUMVA|nr:Facilitated trehalose transporter Tret1 [Eumeta japonica]
MGASLAFLIIGLVRGYSASALPSIETVDPHLIQSSEQKSWIGSSPPLGAFVGSMFSGTLMQRAGRKRTLQLTAPLWAAGWLLLGFGQTLALVLVARFMCGFCVGLVLAPTQIYHSANWVGKYASTSTRTFPRKDDFTPGTAQCNASSAIDTGITVAGQDRKTISTRLVVFTITNVDTLIKKEIDTGLSELFATVSTKRSRTGFRRPLFHHDNASNVFGVKTMDFLVNTVVNLIVRYSLGLALCESFLFLKAENWLRIT